MAPKKNRLGGGLGSLMPLDNVYTSTNTSGTKTTGKATKTVVKEVVKEVIKPVEQTVNINTIEPNKSQPRKTFDLDALEELSASIKQYGIIQPLVVAKHIFHTCAWVTFLREAQKSLLDAEERILAAEYNTKLCEISLLQISGKITKYLE